MEKLKVIYDNYEKSFTKSTKRLKECNLCKPRIQKRRRKNTEDLPEETSDINKAALKLIDDANKLTDPLAKLTAFKIFRRHNIHLTIQCCRSKNLNHQTITWALKLTRNNMEKLYDESDWGWDEKSKRQEMTHPDAWYLIVQNTDQTPVAFVHFRFDLDFDVPVLYCYEIQLEEFIRRSGLGRYLMLTLELLARQNKMKKVMLTVFKHNEIGRDFFIRKLRYEIDETSPECEAASYEILSKRIPNKLELPDVKLEENSNQDEKELLDNKTEKSDS